MSAESPYTIAVPDAKLAHLRAKLDLATLPDELDDAGWAYGAPRTDIARLVSRWKDGYDWRAHEAALNAELQQFTRDIEVEGHGALNIHYVHHQSAAPDAIPLLFVHGWPGSFLEVRKILPLLTAASPEHPSFHVVAYSLPGYGFSEGPKKKGFNTGRHAEVGHKLMLALGYNEYVTQGGDWGYHITRKIALAYGEKHSKAWHTNFPRGQRPPPTFLSQLLAYTPFGSRDEHTETEKAGLARTMWFQKIGRGYSAIQSTQPQTLGYSLADSPVGLLAWIYEKLHNWTDDYPWEDDELLTWVSVYWFSRAGPAASIRIYYEDTQNGDRHSPTHGQAPTIPLGFSRFPKELIVVPKKWTQSLGNVVFDNTHERGGHFAAHEMPEALVGDVRSMFGRGGPAFGVVPGKTGYA